MGETLALVFVLATAALTTLGVEAIGGGVLVKIERVRWLQLAACAAELPLALARCLEAPVPHEPILLGLLGYKFGDAL